MGIHGVVIQCGKSLAIPFFKGLHRGLLLSCVFQLMIAISTQSIRLGALKTYQHLLAI
jgi:hypothetical protein